MSRDSITKIGWGGFFAFLLGLLVLPMQYASWAHLLWVMWTSGCIAYSLSVESDRPLLDLLKNAAITCLILGGLAMLFYGEPSMDEDGYAIEEGFPTTFDSKAGAGLRLFIKLIVGAYVGIHVAELIRNREKSDDEVAQSTGN
jgi:hypothetical protein